MDRVAIGPVKGLKVAIAAFVLSVVLFVIVVGGLIVVFATRNDELERFSQDLRAGLVRNCETNGNPLREAVRGQLREEIHKRGTIDYSRFFPDIPPAELESLLAQQNRADHKTLRKLAPVDCPSLFPSP